MCLSHAPAQGQKEEFAWVVEGWLLYGADAVEVAHHVFAFAKFLRNCSGNHILEPKWIASEPICESSRRLGRFAMMLLKSMQLVQ
eukprot:3938000-Amphidinium_carterae.1